MDDVKEAAPAEADRLGLGPRPLYPLKAGFTRGRSLAWAVRKRRRADLSGVRILFYHRVSDDRDELAVKPRRFREQMDLLASAGYRVLDIAEVVELLAADGPPVKAVGLSFDDGYLDIAEHALPVLQERGFRATVFVVTGALDGTVAFSWYAEQPPLLPWSDVTRLDREGTFRFEAHTVTHPNLLAVAEERAREEIAGSKSALEARLRRPVTAFSYPAGLFGERERALVAESGYRAAVSCEPGVNRRETDPLALRRIQVDARDSLLDFHAKVAGGHDSPPRARALYRRYRYGAGRGSPRSASSRR